MNGRQRVFGMRSTEINAHSARRSRGYLRDTTTTEKIQTQKYQIHNLMSVKATQEEEIDRKRNTKCLSIVIRWNQVWTSEVQSAKRNYVCKIFCRSHFWRCCCFWFHFCGMYAHSKQFCVQICFLFHLVNDTTQRDKHVCVLVYLTIVTRTSQSVSQPSSQLNNIQSKCTIGKYPM